MTAINLSAADFTYLDQLAIQGVRDQSKLAEAWRFLGSKDDAYAFLAGKIVSSNTAED